MSIQQYWTAFASDWRNTVIVLSFLIIFLQTYKLLKDTFVFPIKRAFDVPEVADDSSTHDTIALYILGGDPNAISASPFSTKIVLFCRMAGIPHSTHEPDMAKNPKGKAPYAMHGKTLIADSQLIIRYLENTFDIKRMAPSSRFQPYEALTDDQKALCNFVRSVCDGDLYWATVSARWLGAAGLTKTESNWETTVRMYFGKIPAAIRGLITALIRVIIAHQAHGVGFARHSPADQLYFGKRAFKTLSTVLGEKPYFLGDFPSEADCIVFGVIEGSLNPTWTSPLADYVKDDCQNLIAYAKRIRATYFPDVSTSHEFPPAVVEGLKPIRKEPTRK